MAPNIRIAPGSVSAHLGEGPHWNAETQELLFVDVLGKSVFRYIPRTQECFKVTIDEPSVSIVIPLDNQPNKYIITAGRSLKLLEWDGCSSTPTSLKTLITIDDVEHKELNCLNDGKCDSTGRLWAGITYRTLMGHFEQAAFVLDNKKGSLYSFKRGELKKHVEQVEAANGLTWSPDNKTMYYIDSLSYRVDAYDFDVQAGTISNGRIAFDVKANGVTGTLDGMTIDSEGKLWIAVWDGGKVIRVDPDSGKIINEIDIPSPSLKITSVAFGGHNLETLYVTSACNSTPDGKPVFEGSAGALFEITGLGVRGLSAGQNYIGTF